jgi:hypothetical protein
MAPELIGIQGGSCRRSPVYHVLAAPCFASDLSLRLLCFCSASALLLLLPLIVSFVHLHTVVVLLFLPCSARVPVPTVCLYLLLFLSWSTYAFLLLCSASAPALLTLCPALFSCLCFFAADLLILLFCPFYVLVLVMHLCQHSYASSPPSFQVLHLEHMHTSLKPYVMVFIAHIHIYCKLSTMELLQRGLFLPVLY